MRACLRETDTVARLGGDEFAVLLAPLQRPQDAIRVVEHILSSLREPIMLKSGTSVTAPVSIGIATYPAHGGTAEALLRAADGAMYDAKRRSGHGKAPRRTAPTRGEEKGGGTWHCTNHPQDRIGACLRPRRGGTAASWRPGLAGCQTAPYRKLTAQQVETLRQQGFHLTGPGWELDLSEKVLFGFDDDAIPPERQSNLRRIGQALLGAGIDHVRLDGHTDDAGSTDYNLKLSLRRAQAIAGVLVSAGFARDDIEVRALGMSRPVADNHTPEGRAQNRRVAIIVTVD